MRQTTREKYCAMIQKSWTYKLLTHSEKEVIMYLLQNAPIFGTRQQRWQTLEHIYEAFLAGTGYYTETETSVCEYNPAWERRRRAAQ